MIARVPAAIAARNGASSTSSSSSRVAETTGSPRCESTSVAPWPGKCFAQAATPPAWSPVTKAATWRATSAGSEPNERTPITGLSGFDVDVGDRSEVQRDAGRARARRRGRGRPARSSATSSIVPSASGAGQRAAAAGLEPGDVAALLVDRDDGGGGDPERSGQRPQLLRPRDVAREEDDAAEPVGELAREPGRGRRPGEARRGCTPFARRSSESLIPWSRRP